MIPAGIEGCILIRHRLNLGIDTHFSPHFFCKSQRKTRTLHAVRVSGNAGERPERVGRTFRERGCKVQKTWVPVLLIIIMAAFVVLMLIMPIICRFPCVFTGFSPIWTITTFYYEWDENRSLRFRPRRKRKGRISELRSIWWRRRSWFAVCSQDNAYSLPEVYWCANYFYLTFSLTLTYENPKRFVLSPLVFVSVLGGTPYLD